MINRGPLKKILFLIVASLLAAGCAAPGAVARLEEEIAIAQATANEALRRASTAQLQAEEAIVIINKIADEGGERTQALAEQALKKAELALKEAERAKKRADRMYRKAVGK